MLACGRSAAENCLDLRSGPGGASCAADATGLFLTFTREPCCLHRVKERPESCTRTTRPVAPFRGLLDRTLTFHGRRGATLRLRSTPGHACTPCRICMPLHGREPHFGPQLEDRLCSATQLSAYNSVTGGLSCRVPIALRLDIQPCGRCRGALPQCRDRVFASKPEGTSAEIQSLK
jgi:hypothetical protein